jgi:HAD superfamily hydrolase (TIGR01490 family)
MLLPASPITDSHLNLPSLAEVPPALALFDLDDTLVLGNTVLLYFRDQYRRGKVSKRALLRAFALLAGYKLDLVDMMDVIAQTTLEAKGSPESELQQIGDDLYPQVQALLCPGAVAAVKAHQARGDVVAIVTASTAYIAQPVAKFLGIHHAVCTEVEVKDGFLTGQLIGLPCYGHGKIGKAEALAQQVGLPLSQAWFYTDSRSDVPLLEVVARPRVVRPDPRLRLHAKRHGWPILPW